MQARKLITGFSPYNITHATHSHPPSSNIWGAAAELLLIMFEIRLCCFHTLEMQRGKQIDSERACFRNIYYPIKMCASESSNYLQLSSGMMNGVVGLFSPTWIHLVVHWRSAPIHTLRMLSIFWLGVYFRVQESVRLTDGLSVCECVGEDYMCVCFPNPPRGMQRRGGSNGGTNSEQVCSHVNKDIVWLSLIKCLPKAGAFMALIKKKKSNRWCD